MTMLVDGALVMPARPGSVQRTIPAARTQILGTGPTICHLLHSLEIGGAEILAAQLARKLVGSCRFVFACLDELGSLGQRLAEEGFPVHVLHRRPGFDWRCARRLAEILRRERVDLVHAHQYAPFFYGMIARLLYRRVPILFTEHGRHFPDYPRRKRIFMNRLLLRRGDRVVGVGEAVRRALIENEGLSTDRVGVIYNGIDFAPFAGGAPDRISLRKEIGVQAQDLVILQVARFDYLKDHSTAVRVLERVAKRRPEVRLVLIGDGPERKRIEELISRRRLEPQIRLLGRRRDVARLLHAGDLFLLTSISEGIPLTLIEAMAAGLPVVSTNVGGVPEVVEDGRTGLLSAAQDDAFLAECILRLADSQALRVQMGRLGRERAFTHFSETRMHGLYLRYYREMLRG